MSTVRSDPPKTLPPDETKTVVEGPSTAAEVPAAAVGSTLGRYVVLAEAGRGGMGRVLRAYDPKLQREVALKELRPAALDDDGTARLVAEARAMARLSHANVVGVFDVESLAGGEIVIVMEYVAGTTLREWLREAPRDWQTRLVPLLAAGRGLAAAHAAGILHRDFKPANVLVGAAGMVKVGDFGLAKGTAPDSLDPLHPTRGMTSSEGHSGDDLEFVHTRADVVLGTPRYMAPEQWLRKALTAAADQYAYCVTVWEALAGAPPFTSKNPRKLLELKQAGPPAWPADAPAVPRALIEVLRRGLAPEPAQRWPSMGALLEALAADPGRRRRQLALGVGGGAFAAALVAATVAGRPEPPCTGAPAQLAGVWDEARRAEAEAAVLGIGASFAEAAWSRTRTALDAYAEAWVTMHTEACEATSVRGEQSPAVLDLRMACLHRARTELTAVSEILRGADGDVVHHAHELVEGLMPLQRCADIAALQAEVEPPDAAEAADVERVRSLLAQAHAERTAGRHARAQEHLDAAERVAAPLAYGPIQAELALGRGRLLFAQGRYEDADVALRNAVSAAARHHLRTTLRDAATVAMFVVGYRLERPKEAAAYADVARGLATDDPLAEAAIDLALGRMLHAEGKYAEATLATRRGLDVRLALLGPGHGDVAEAQGDLAFTLATDGKQDEAEQVVRDAIAAAEAHLGADHPELGSLRDTLGTTLREQGKLDEAEAEHRRALDIQLRALGPGHPYVPGIQCNIASVYLQRGDAVEAEQLYRTCLAGLTAALGPDDPATAGVRHNFIGVLYQLGKHAEAEPEARAQLAALERRLGPDHPDVTAMRGNLAGLLLGLGRTDEAEAQVRAATRSCEATRGADHVECAVPRVNLALMLLAQEKFAEAEVEYRRVIAVREKQMDAEHPQLAVARVGLAELLLRDDRAAEALPLAELALQRLDRDDVRPHDRARASYCMARALWPDAKARKRARAFGERARDFARAAGPSAQDRLASIETWLQTHVVR